MSEKEGLGSWATAATDAVTTTAAVAASAALGADPGDPFCFPLPLPYILSAGLYML